MALGTKKTLIILVIGVFAWSTLLPIFLVRNLDPSEPVVSTQFRPGLTSHVIRKPTDGAWTLADANPAEITSLTWYEKARLVVDNNRNYLDQVKDRATKPSSNITLVSGLFDLGRGELGNGFNRKFTEYVNRFATFMKYDFPKIIYIQPEHYELYSDLIESSPGPVHVINMTLDEIRAQPFYEYVQDIRVKEEWYSRAGWLKDAPQATLALYNPMVMSKIYWTRDAARVNPFNTDSFLWIDGGHLCNRPDKITQDNAEIFKRHFDKVLMTLFEYVPNGEIHGFEEEAYREYTDSMEDTYLYVGRGGIFGGTKEFLEVTSEVYSIALMDSLQKGFMGTEENIFAILWYRFPELIHGYQNEQGGNCAIWYEAIHQQPPTPIEHPKFDVVEGGWDLRGLRCEGRNDDIVCYDGKNKCPAHVTPAWLEMGDKQYACTREENFCTVACRGDKVNWFAHGCPSRGSCPPHGTFPWSKFYDTNPLPDHKVSIHFHPRIKEKRAQEIKNALRSQHSQNLTKFEKDFNARMKSKYSPETRKMLQEHGYDLRGLHCGILNNKPTCYRKFVSGIEICPSWITPEFLTEAKGQWACRPGAPDSHCLAQCQEGTDKISWIAQQTSWCASNPDRCEPRPEVIPYEEFHLREWPYPPKVPPKCDQLSVSKFKNMKPITVGVLARGNELETVRVTMRTWEERGFLQYIDEFVFMINNVSPEMLSYLKDYTKPPYNAKVIYDEGNKGILSGLNWLMGNSTNDYFLFLEKDFRLVESLPCTLEQLQAGLDLLESGKADVIKYRSRYNPGRPNWAESLYRDKEETVFERQPNLLCNFYHWVDHPEERWPEHFKVCHEDPIMYCSDAFFCNWTNNPFLIDKNWWFREYYEKYAQFRDPPKELDLETFMNWEPGAWNERGWTIAQGEGMFKHSDTTKFGF